MCHIDSILLEREACHFHFCFFHRSPSESLKKNYILAHAEFPDLQNPPENQLKSVHLIIEKKLNALGIEPWLRKKKNRHILTSKILLISYLAECDASHQEFCRQSSGRLYSWIDMALSGLEGILNLLHGYIQKTRYGLV